MAAGTKNGGPDATPKSVAVIAVHGVGYTEPCATATRLADVLLGLGRHQLDPNTPWPPDKQPPPYASFNRVPIAVPLKPPHINPASDPKRRFQDDLEYLGKSVVHAWDERLGYLAYAFGRTNKDEQKNIEAEVARDPAKIGHEFMRTQIGAYFGGEDGRAFDTSRLEGERTDGDKTTKVHIYEAYWADLARPQNSILSFLMAFYQLLFHLGSLSRTAVYYAALEHISERRWRVVSFLQAFSSRILVIPIPVLNLVLLLAALAVLPLKIPDTPLSLAGLAVSSRAVVAALVAGLIALAAILLVPQLRLPARTPRQWLLTLGGTFAAAALVALWVACQSPLAADTVLAVDWWILGAVLINLLLERYDQVRRSAQVTGMALVGLSFIAFCFCLSRTDPARYLADRAYYLEDASFWTVVIVMAALVLCWAVFVGSAILLWISNVVCLRSKMPDAQRGRAHAAVRTGRLTLSVSASVFLLATIFLWAGIFKYGAERAALYSGYTPTPPPLGWLSGPLNHVIPPPAVAASWLQRFGTDPKPPEIPLTTQGPLYVPNNQNFRDYARALLLVSVTSGLPVMLVLGGIGLFSLAWAVLPSLVPKRADLHKATNQACSTMGNWLSHGLDSTRAVTGFVWHSIFTVAALFATLDMIACYFPSISPENSLLWKFVHWNTVATLNILDVTGQLFAVSGIALAALILKYGTTPLDIILDVDNYLRTSPLNNTPRARIAERYISLLRYVAAQKDSEKKPLYDSIVIGAHSLGALISADLLMFLTKEGDPDLGPLGLGTFDAKGKRQPASIRLSLLTFGNPLRQLLNRFFPHLYWWVKEEPDNSLHPLAQGAIAAADVTASKTPDPASLTLKHWVSLYRSGDFVGRPMWLNNWYNRTNSGPKKPSYADDIQIFQPRAQAHEACIGLGGHNDYWNRTAPDLAERLDRLIAGKDEEKFLEIAEKKGPETGPGPLGERVDPADSRATESSGSQATSA